MTDPLTVVSVVALGLAIGTLAYVAAVELTGSTELKSNPRGAGTSIGSSISNARRTIVDSATRIIGRRNGRSLQEQLERSGSQLRSGEWVIAVASLMAVAGGLSFLIRGLIAAVLVSVAVVIVARFMLSHNIRKRQEAFADQLPDVILNLSSALRSGQSIQQAVATIAPDLEAPAGEELRRVVIENRIGRDLVQSFRELAQRMDSVDFDWVVRAIEINHSTGGDLPSILRRLDATIRARNHVAGTVRSLTADGRISGVVLTALPPALMICVQFVNPGYLEPLFGTSLGRLLLIGATLMLVIGGVWLTRLARFRY